MYNFEIVLLLHPNNNTLEINTVQSYEPPPRDSP